MAATVEETRLEVVAEVALRRQGELFCGEELREVRLELVELAVAAMHVPAAAVAVFDVDLVDSVALARLADLVACDRSVEVVRRRVL